MNISKKNYRFLQKLIPELVKAKDISQSTAENILNAVTPLSFDWKRLARYSLWASLTSLIISILFIFNDSLLIELLKQFFNSTATAKLICCTFLTGFFYTIGTIKRIKNLKNIYTNESLMFLGVLANAAAIYLLPDVLNIEPRYFSLLILAASICYGSFGFLLKSPLVWCFSLLSFGAWLGSDSGNLSGWGNYFISQNHTLSFVIFGIVSLIGATIFQTKKAFQPFFAVTRNLGLLYLFLSLWILSLTGMHTDIKIGEVTKQFTLLPWSLLLSAASAFTIFVGCKWDDSAYRGFGLTFLFINFYTRFFEYFWNSMNSAAFFFLLALSLWYIGSRAERIWLKLG